MIPTKKPLRVVITGANGFVGHNIGKFFSEKGIFVFGIVRKGKAVHVKFGKPIISNDLSEKNLVGKLKNCSAMIHLIGKGKQTIENDYEKTNVHLTKKAINLCKKCGIKKIIYISGLGVEKDTTFGYFISKYKAEQEIIHSGLDYTIFRASYIIGKDDPLSKILCKQIKKGIVIVPGSGNYRIQPIFIDDVASIFLKAILEKKFSKKTIDLVGPQTVSYSRFILNFIRRRKVKIKKMELENAYKQALHDKNSQYGVDDLNIMIGDFVGNHQRLQQMSAIKFKTYTDVLKTSGRS